MYKRKRLGIEQFEKEKGRLYFYPNLLSESGLLGTLPYAQSHLFFWLLLLFC